MALMSSTVDISKLPAPLLPFRDGNASRTWDKPYVQSLVPFTLWNDMIQPMMEQIGQSYTPIEQGRLAASQAISGPYAQLMSDLYAKYGPMLNATGNQINRQNQMAQAETDASVLAGPGQDLIKAYNEMARLADPEFYNTRALTADNISKLLGSIDLSGGLSDTELRSIQQGLNREGQQRGDVNAPSASATAANAMRYGEAGRARQTESQNQLAKAIAASTAFLPASRTGVDTFQMATGKSATPNPGAALFKGVAEPGDTAAGASTGIFGNTAQLTDSAYNRRLQNNLSSSSWLDNFQAFTSGIGNLTQGAASMFKPA